MTARRLRAAAAVLLLSAVPAIASDWFIPVKATDRRSWREVRLTAIGTFGLQRKARRGIPAHLHTGVDIARPSRDDTDEPVYPAAPGTVISVRDDGPFAQVIIEHRPSGGSTVWTVYEHLAGIRVAIGDTVEPGIPIGRFMTRAELDRHGWQFDHLHFEVLRLRPGTAQPTKRLPARLFQTYALACADRAALLSHYFDPETFLEDRWRLHQ